MRIDKPTIDDFTLSTHNHLDDAGGGVLDYVRSIGTPAALNNQVAVFTDGDTIEGDSKFTWDGTTLNVDGGILWHGLAANFKAYSGTNDIRISTATASATAGNILISTIEYFANGYHATIAGTGNVGIGVDALNASITGSDNVAIGRWAGYNITSGYSMVHIGRGAGNYISTGNNIIAIGSRAGEYNNGDNIIAIGQLAGYFSTTVAITEAVSIGHSAGYKNTGVGSVHVGNFAGYQSANQGGNYNVHLGYAAGSYGNANSDNSVAIGYNAAIQNSTSRTIAIGERSMGSVNPITGADNIGIGYQTLQALSSGVGNVAIGKNAGYAVQTGSYNVFIGFEAGEGVAEGTSNVLIIHNSDNITTPLVYGNFSTPSIRFNASVNINGAYTLPTSDGTTGYVLATNGSGIVTWAAVDALPGQSNITDGTDQGQILYWDDTSPTSWTAASVADLMWDNGTKVLMTVGFKIPTGAAAGYVLTSDADGDASWQPAASTYTDEMAQDAVGGILSDSANIDLTYSDTPASISALISIASQASQDIMYYSAGGAWTRFAKGANDTYLHVSSGGMLEWSSVLDGTGTQDQIAFWSGSPAQLSGDDNFTWDGSLLYVTGNTRVDGEISVGTAANGYLINMLGDFPLYWVAETYDSHMTLEDGWFELNVDDVNYETGMVGNIIIYDGHVEIIAGDNVYAPLQERSSIRLDKNDIMLRSFDIYDDPTTSESRIELHNDGHMNMFVSDYLWLSGNMRITGSFRYTNGSTPGDVLTADDTDGNASWQPLATGYDTLYDISAVSDGTPANVYLRLNGSGTPGSTDDVQFLGGNGVTVEATEAHLITISSVTYAIGVVEDESSPAIVSLQLLGSDASFDNVTLLAGDNITVTMDDVSTISIAALDTTYGISAVAVTGGAYLRLTGSDASTDDVKFVSGSGMNITRTDANNINVACSIVQYTDAMAQNAVGNILLDSNNIGLDYITNTSISAIIQISGETQGDLMWFDSKGFWNRLPAGAEFEGCHLILAHGGLTPTWASVPTDNNTTYAISSVTTTGGAFLRLTSTNPSGTDDVKFASGTGITVAYTDINTITVNSTITQYTNENAQDTIGSILADSANIDLTYSDSPASISALISVASQASQDLMYYSAGGVWTRFAKGSVGTFLHISDSNTLTWEYEADPWFYGVMTTTGHYTGFVDRTGNTLSWNDGTYTLTIAPESAPAADDFTIYINGVGYLISTPGLTKQITDATGIYWFWIESVLGVPTLQMQASTPPGFDKCLVATVYWNTTTNKGLLGDERHWMGRDKWMHEYLHETIGTRYGRGLGGAFTNTTFLIGEGEIYDEDLEFAIGDETTCEMLYHNGSAAWEWDTGNTTPYKVRVSGGDNILQYNNVNALADVTTNRYMATWVFASNHPSNHMYVIMGNQSDVNLTDARNNNTISNLSLGTLPAAEMKLIYRVIWRNVGNQPVYIESADYRNSSSLPVSNYVPTSHSSLSGLSADDHMQYALLAGRVGGQTLYGGTATTDDLDLYATINGTNNGFINMHDDVNVYGTLYVDTIDAFDTPGITQVDSELEITNMLRITTGAAAGYVLASDASGNAAWSSVYDLDLVSGTGASGQVAFWTDTPAQLSGDDNFEWDGSLLHVTGNLRVDGLIGIGVAPSTYPISATHAYLINWQSASSNSYLQIYEYNFDYYTVSGATGSNLFVDNTHINLAVGLVTTVMSKIDVYKTYLELRSLDLNGVDPTIQSYIQVNSDGSISMYGDDVIDIMSSFKYSVAPSAGYVLTSDADGNATWEDPGSAGVTYTTSVIGIGTPTIANIRLTGSDASTDDIEIVGSGGVVVTPTDGNTITLSLGTPANIRVAPLVIASPNAQYTSDTQLPHFKTPAAITISKVTTSLNTTGSEVAGDLKYADDLTSFTSATVICAFDTTSGVSEVTGGFGDATVPAGKYIYVQWDSAPAVAITWQLTQIQFTYD